MKILLLALLAIPSFLYAQENHRDSYTLKGTTVLIGSDKNMQSYHIHGYRLSNLHSSECESGGRFEEIKEDVLSVSKTDSAYNISINVLGNCTHAFLGEIEIKNDSIINLISHGYGGASTCLCCFGLTYTISFDQNSSKKVKYVMINGIRETMVELEEVSNSTPEKH